MRAILGVFVGLVFCSALQAQEIPLPKPTDAHKLLWKDEGTWDCEVKWYLQGPTGPALDSTGVEANEVVSGKMSLLSSFKCKLGTAVFEGRGLMGYNPKSKKYEGVWTDSFTSSPTKIVGTFSKDGKVLTVLSKVMDPSGQEVSQKQVTTYKDENTKTMVIYMVVAEGDKKMDVKLFEMTAKRRKKKK